jgi:hypothetical protein
LILCLNIAVHFIPDSHRYTNSNGIPCGFVRAPEKVEFLFGEIVAIILDLIEQIKFGERRLPDRDELNDRFTNVRANRFADFPDGFEHLFLVILGQIVA